ncbi:LamG-like jellyroll fold domain-containing protein [Pontiella sulfatireligans]|nr:LamG-like jellyroll fold domain-containing protein [Pontiella sulfatireligans]
MIIALCLTVSGVAHAATSGDVVVSPENKGVFIDKFFKDYKSGNNPNPSNGALDDLFIDDGLNGIRTPIWGNINQPAHPTNGVVISSYYTGHVNTILRAKERNPDLIVFASKKLNGDDSFPDWTKDGSGVLATPYAEMLADYIEYMATQGIEIDVLGIDNERQYNEGNITPSRHKDIVDELQALSTARGFPMPLIIGHEDFQPNRNSWMANLMNNGWGDRLDLFGTHYYPNSRPLANLQSDLGWAGSREKWHTELHWDTKAENDDMDEAEQAICALWDCIDNGMNGFMWWSYSRTGFRGSLMKACSVPITQAHALAVDDFDGAGISTLGKLQTRAFLKGSQLTIYALNVNSGSDYSNMVFRIDSGRILGHVSAQQWTSTNQTSGTVSAMVPLDGQSFEFTLPDRSISSFTFTYAPGGLFSHYPFEGDADDISPNALHGTEIGGVSYPAGRAGFAASGTIGIPFASFDDLLAAFWLKTDVSSGALIAGDELTVDLAASNVVFSIGTNSVTSFKPINDGRWHHVAAERTVAVGEMRLYVDGRLEAYGNGAGAALSETSLVLGGFAGLLDEVKFYDRALQSNDVSNLYAPSVLLDVGGNAEERGPVESFVALTQCPAGSDYPYIDLVEDDGSWLPGYNGTTKRNMATATASDPALPPNAGSQYFKTTTGSWWRGMNKPQLDNLLVEAGTYTVSFYVGDADTNVLFCSAGDTNLPVAGNHVGLTATDPVNPVLPDMNASVNSLLHYLDPAVTVNFNVTAVPGDGQWMQWGIDYTVPTNSPMIGRELGFLFRKPSSSIPETTAAFDGPLIIDFIPAETGSEPWPLIEYDLAGSTATPTNDYDALPSLLVMGTNAIVPVADLIEEGTEHIVLDLIPSTNYYIAGSASGIIAIIDHPMDAWRAEEFGANAANPAIAGDVANPDGDALSNELEWTLVTDPLVADRPAMTPTISDPYFIASYKQRLNGFYTVGASWSCSLTDPDWRTDDMITSKIGESGDVETWAVLLSLEGTNKFVRIEVSE